MANQKKKSVIPKYWKYIKCFEIFGEEIFSHENTYIFSCSDYISTAAKNQQVPLSILKI